MGGHAAAGRRSLSITLDESQEGVHLAPCQLLGIVSRQPATGLGDCSAVLPGEADGLLDLSMTMPLSAVPMPSCHVRRPGDSRGDHGALVVQSSIARRAALVKFRHSPS